MCQPHLFQWKNPPIIEGWLCIFAEDQWDDTVWRMWLQSNEVKCSRILLKSIKSPWCYHHQITKSPMAMWKAAEYPGPHSQHCCFGNCNRKSLFIPRWIQLQNLLHYRHAAGVWEQAVSVNFTLYKAGKIQWCLSATKITVHACRISL
jgi:hypothetical protein